jgi:hypothetical protein
MEAILSGNFSSYTDHFTSFTSVAAIPCFPMPLFLGGNRK